MNIKLDRLLDSRIKVSEIKELIATHFSKETHIYVNQNVFKQYKTEDYCLGVSIDSSITYLIMNQDLEVIRLENCNVDGLEDKLVGKQLDASSLKEYNLYVHDKYKSLNHTRILGKIVDNKVVSFNKDNFLDLLEKQTESDAGEGKKRPVHNSESFDVFVQICGKYKNYIENLIIVNESATEVIVDFNVKGRKFRLNLYKFFNYDLKLSMDNVCGKKNLYLKLAGYQCDASQYPQIIEELLTEKLSPLTKVYLATVLSNSYLDHHSYEKQKDGNYILRVGYNSMVHKVHGKYEFLVDLNKNQVSVINNKKSKKFIPERVNRMNDRLKEVLA